jgi:hypothetical protein
MSIIEIGSRNPLVAHAERELALAGFTNACAPEAAQAAKIMSLIRILSTQEHSAASLEQCLSIAMALAHWQILSPLTGKEDEWLPVDADGKQRNKRCTSVYRDLAGVFFDGAILWRTPEGKKFVGTLSSGAKSVQPLKLPSYPRSVEFETLPDESAPAQAYLYEQAAHFFETGELPEEPAPE